MAKCPRSGAKLTTASGAVVKAVPIGFVGRRRSNAVCVVDGGETWVSVVHEDGRKAMMPRSLLVPAAKRVKVAPPTHHAARQHDRMPNLFPQPLAPGVNGIDEIDTLRLYGSCVKRCRRSAPQSLGPCIDRCQESGGGLSGTDDYHAHSASMWATNAVEEAELGAGDALHKGQCNRALESLVRAERKTTMASTNATQTGNPRLKAKALASNTLVNALWREFQTKCIRRYPGDHPGAVLPFGGVKDEAYVHPRATKAVRVGDYANTVMAGGHLKTVVVLEVFPNGMLSVRGVQDRERHIVDPRTTYKMPHAPGSLGGLGGEGSLHERIAAVLGWSVHDVQGFSLQMLREMVRGKDPNLAQEISDTIQGGGHIRSLGETRYTLPDVE